MSVCPELRVSDQLTLFRRRNQVINEALHGSGTLRQWSTALVAAVLLCSSAATSQAGSITVTSPNGGEVWVAGATQTVTWEGADLTGDVNAYLYDNGQYIAWLGTVPASAGSLDWVVCETVGSGDAYTIWLYAQDALGYASDSSDAPFSISGATPRPQFQLTYPMGGETLTAGSTVTITWTTTDPQGNINIELHKSGQWYSSIAQPAMADGSFDWTICQELEDADDWTIQLTWYDCIYLSSASATFSTAGGGGGRPTVTLTSPNGGEVFQAGTRQTITWESVNPSGGIGINLYNNSGWYAYLGYAEMSANTFDWDICTGLDNRDDYWISLDGTDACGGYIGDSSDGRFTVVGATPEPVPTLTLTAPAGVDAWAIGTTQAITWSSTNPSGTAYLSLYRHGSYVAYLGSAPMADGALNWYVCSPLGPGEGYAISIYGYDGCGRYVPSGSGPAFSLTPGSTGGIEVTSPGGGETWQAGTTETITWTTPNPTGSVNIWLYKGGVQYRYLGWAQASAGMFQYQVCELFPAASDYRVFIEQSSSCGNVSDVSDADFSIGGVVGVSVLSPNGGETLAAGTTVPITWSAPGTSPNTYAYIQLLKNGNPYQFLAYVPAASGSYDWAICPHFVTGTDYTVEISIYGCATATDRSDSTFAVTSSTLPPVLTITSPNGGEIVTAGSDTTITWTASNFQGSIEVALVRSDATRFSLGWVDAADGSLAWHVCEYYGNGSDYRIEIIGYDLCGLAVTDRSDDTFTIEGSLTRPSFSLISPLGGSHPLGTEFTVTWEVVNPTGYVEIWVEKPGEVSYWLGQAWAADQTFSGWVGEWIEPGGGYAVRLSWCECGVCVEEQSPPAIEFFVPPPADLNRDGRVNGDDFALFKPCVTGPTIPYAPPAPWPSECTLAPDLEGILPADLDRDGDVDASDFGIFQGCYNGSALANPACAD